MCSDTLLALSGERFRVVYRIVGEEAEARARATEICCDQTVEFPLDLVPRRDILDGIVGRIESLAPVDGQHWEAIISYPVEISGLDLMEFLNVVFGTISIKWGIRVERFDLPPVLLRAFRGPRFGREGLRALLGAPQRPLIATALKPLGLSPAELAEQAYHFALGGVDLIKDDHILADHSFCPYRERVERCAEAVHRANRETGGHSLYAPTVPGPVERMAERAAFAKDAGAGALLVCPGLTGLDMMRRLADDDRIGLPIVSNPACQGTYATGGEVGLSWRALFGEVARLAGADASIFGHFGSQFTGTERDCLEAVAGCEAPMSHIRPIFPMPAGGVTLERLLEFIGFYGCDVMFLVSTGLHRPGPDLTANARAFREVLERAAVPSFAD
jgi:ribulose-bisphosphate carboxylase large chain